MSLRSFTFSESKKGGLKRLIVNSAEGFEDFDLSDPVTLACLAIRGYEEQVESDLDEIEEIVKQEHAVETDNSELNNTIEQLHRQISAIKSKQEEFELAKLYLDNVKEANERNQLMINEQLRQKLDLLENLNSQFNFAKRANELDNRVKEVEKKTLNLESRLVTASSERSRSASTSTKPVITVKKPTALTRTTRSSVLPKVDSGAVKKK